MHFITKWILETLNKMFISIKSYLQTFLIIILILRKTRYLLVLQNVNSIHIKYTHGKLLMKNFTWINYLISSFWENIFKIYLPKIRVNQSIILDARVLLFPNFGVFEKQYFHRNIFRIIFQMKWCAIFEFKFTIIIHNHQYSTIRLVN